MTSPEHSTGAVRRTSRWWAIVPAAIIVLSVLAWWSSRDPLPPQIRIATGEPGGLYAELGEAYGRQLEAGLQRSVSVVTTSGSVDNREALLAGAAELAILQAGAASLEGLSVIAPLYPEIVHAIARSDLGLDSVEQLADRRVVLGPEGSGMRISAARLLDHYRLTERVESVDATYFGALAEDPSLDGAVVTTGFLNRDLQSLLELGSFRLLPILDANAVALRDPYFEATVLPRGLFRGEPPIPETDIPTVQSTALLVARSDASSALLNSATRTLYEGDLHLRFPALISADDAISSSPAPLHPVARRLLNPPDQIGRFAAVMESLAAFKELSVALAAGLYLLWVRWRQRRDAAQARSIQAQKDELDRYLERTLEIERAQMAALDNHQLQSLLDRVTEIKLEALERLTHEELRSDQAFSIFILQCGNLINKIQMKIVHQSLER